MPKRPVTILAKTPDTETFTDAEVKAAFESLFGSWADRDDGIEETLAALRNNWTARLIELHDPTPPTKANPV